ncbi:MAG: PP2C family protein-serine/threonine phosphatase [Sporichthyaceae bacterium]
MALALKFVARSDVGLIREGNEDSGYAGPSLLAVADGMGGHAAGEVASSVALSTLAALEEDVPATELLGALAAAVAQANEAISDLVEKHPQLDGMGTTLTALLWSGRRIGVVHIGDSRAYLLRGGVLDQITHDHTFVQQLQDEGRITAEEAAVHPQRSLLLRCLDGRNAPEPDLSVREMQLGDRLLVCSDGLSGVVSDTELAIALTNPDLGVAADTLIQMALRAGGPDNITCVVADVVEVAEALSDDPQVVGAAGGKHRPKVSGATSEIDLSGLPEMLAGAKPARRSGRLTTWWMRLLLAGVAAAIVAIGWTAYDWSQSRYYVGAGDGRVTIFKGLHQNVLGKSLSSRYEQTDIPVDDLPPFEREELVDDTFFADDLDKARQIVDRLRSAAAGCRAERMTAEAAATATPTPSPKPTGKIAGVATGKPTEIPTATTTPSATLAPTETAAASPSPSPAPSGKGCDTRPAVGP